MKNSKVIDRPKYNTDIDLSYLSDMQQSILLGRLNDNNINNFDNIEQVYLSNINLTKLVDIARYLPDSDKLLNFMNTKYNKDMHICIISDFDTDGITSCVVIEKSLELMNHTGKVSSIVNKRVAGTGVTDYCLRLLEKINKEQQVDLIILSDHGSSNGKEYKLIQENMIPNVPIILTDHHEVNYDSMGTEYKDNFIFINAHRAYDIESNISNILQSFSGCAIAYLTMLLMAKENYKNLEPLLYLVGMSTISDVMPLDNPYNRFIVRSGMNKLYTEWPYIVKYGIGSNKVTPRGLSFNVIPIINTGNRTDNEEYAYGYVKQDESSIKKLEQANIDRKSQTRLVYDKIMEDPDKIVYPNTIIANLDVNFAIAGNLASKLGEHFYKPAIVFNLPKNDIITASLRGIVPNIDVVKALKTIDKTKGVISRYGGHKQAAGCSIYKERLEEFKQLFDNAIKEQMDTLDTTKYLYIDKYIDSDKIDIGLYKSTELLGPYGKDWDEPTFISKLTIVSIIPIGTMCKFIFKTKNDNTLTGMGFFNKSDLYSYIGNQVHVIYNLEITTRYKQSSLLLRVLEITENSI